MRCSPAPSHRAAIVRCCTWRYAPRVPTDKHRYTITSDPEIERALRRRQRSFPGEPRSKILVRLIKRGDEAIEEEERTRAEREEHRLAAARRLAARFERPDGFDYAALGEASATWLRD